MILLAVDPGPEQSAYVLWDTARKRPIGKDKVFNQLLLDQMDIWNSDDHGPQVDECVIEEVVSYGMAAGRSLFLTCRFSGMVAQHWKHLTDKDARWISRPDVKLSICGSRRANDKDIREELIHRLGPVGTSKEKGPLYGFTADRWAALALAVAFSEGRNE